MPRLTQQDFERLLEFRVTLRRFQRWSEDQAQAEGLTHVQHQLLVAIKGHRGNMPPTVGDLAGYLLLRPHSTVELVDRAEAAGLVERTPDGDDGRVVRVRLTGEGDRVLQKLTRAHLERLHDIATVLDELVTRHGSLSGGSASGGAARQEGQRGAGRSTPSTRLGVSRSCSQRGFVSPALKLLKAASIESRRGSDRPTALPIWLSARLSLSDRDMAILLSAEPTPQKRIIS
jgi:DNA-binding MarR family transcriptional regulator